MRHAHAAAVAQHGRGKPLADGVWDADLEELVSGRGWSSISPVQAAARRLQEACGAAWGGDHGFGSFGVPKCAEVEADQTCRQ